jgi:hypothetical protein
VALSAEEATLRFYWSPASTPLLSTLSLAQVKDDVFSLNPTLLPGRMIIKSISMVVALDKPSSLAKVAPAKSPDRNFKLVIEKSKTVAG